MIGAGLRALDVETRPTNHPALAQLDRVGWALATIGCSAVLAAEVFDEFLGDRILSDFSDLLDPQRERSIFTLASASATCGAALAALLLAVIDPRRRLLHLLICLTFSYLYVDDLFVIHEHLGERFGDLIGIPREDLGVRLWTALYGPLLVLCALLLLRVARRIAAGGRSIVLGLVLLGLAVSLEAAGIVTHFIDLGRIETIERLVRGGLEEALELAGWTVLATGMLIAFGSLLLDGERPARTAAAGG